MAGKLRPTARSLFATAGVVTIPRVFAPLRSQATESFWANLVLIIEGSYLAGLLPLARPPSQLLMSDGSAAP